MTEENGQGVDAQGNWQGWFDGKTSTPSESGPQDWTEGGGAAEDMSQEQARKEIRAIENSPSFAGEGKMPEWLRQNMLKRRTALYKVALGEDAEKPYNGMAESLEKAGVTKETLEADQERFADRDEKETRRKAMDTLISHFGTEDEAKKSIIQARGLLDRFAGPDDLVFLEDAGLGNDPELISLLAKVARIFQKKENGNEGT